MQGGKGTHMDIMEMMVMCSRAQEPARPMGLPSLQMTSSDAVSTSSLPLSSSPRMESL